MAPYTSGTLVHLRGELWQVMHADRCDTCTVLTLEGRGAGNAGHPWRAIAPFDRPVVWRRRRPRRARRDVVLRAARAALTQTRPATGLWTAAAANIDLLPYQLEPALAVLDGATRVLLADAVGLGKTVQAGLILAELQVRALVEHALILVPAGLRLTWAAELRERFGIRVAVLDQAAIAQGAAHLPLDANPWMAHAVIVASIDLVKRPEVLAAVESAPFDALIVDEAHHLMPGSDRGAAVARLAARVPWLVLASATPHSGDDPAFRFLMELGARGDTLTIFRRSRADIGRVCDRRECLLRVRPSPPEAELLSLTEAYARALWRARGMVDPAVRLVAMTIARRAASSPEALARTLARRLALLSGRADPSPLQASLPWEEPDAADADADGNLLATPGLDDARDERRWLAALAAAAHAVGERASKTERLQSLLRRVAEPAVIFTEYRDTIPAIARACPPHARVATVHGGLTPAARQAAVDAFNDGRAEVLVATDTAGEGLNLHHRCRFVVNMELPWNPRRLEQRVGRVDRLGQTRRVHAVHLFLEGTIEGTVLARLERRRQRAAAGLEEASPGWASAEALGASALGGSPLGEVSEQRPPTAIVPRAEVEARRALEHRRGRGRWPDFRGLLAPLWAMPRRPASGARRVAMLFDVRHVDGHGRLLASEAAPVAVELAAPPRDRRAWRLAFERLSVDERIRALVAEACLGSAEAVTLGLTAVRASVTRRLRAVEAEVAVEDQLFVQPSLFDRRAERRARARRDATSCVRAHLTRLAARLGDERAIDVQSLTEVTALWRWPE